MYLPSSKWSWAFLLITLVQAAIILAFEAWIFAVFQIDINDAEVDESKKRPIPTFLTLYIFGFVYQLVLVWDGLRLKNTIQIIGLVLYNVGLLVYGAVQMEQIEDVARGLDGNTQEDIWSRTRPFLIAIPCILGLGTLALAFVAWKLYDEFAWTIYKHISADLRMKRRYLTFQIYIALLKFDFFFFLGFTVQFVVIVERFTIEFYLTIAAIPVTVVILLLAAFFCRRESLIGTIGIIILYFGGLTYFIFKLVRMYSDGFSAPYEPARKELTAFAVLTIILILLTITNACVCAHNYGKGLRPYIVKRKLVLDEEKPTSSSAYAPYATEMQPGAAGKLPQRPTARMEID
ncbi:uncharacterized protein HMPREF1541_01062 [Cyphellophora europaea CBS 101466]|uniref:Uncharacterized protein n=1 Tax=Cyphellophora europaea (strain CBS 101466) TaxID=1220924 RepID=W2SFU9_CYPE1|nr:uncharacterized protein HMPREF1541_01062 [Cyphellophora europaea CBS 101466]ETN46873.1 hypothetical protein HMPREF1541_01062 [Cyphellophora europaea CBS 101466]